MIIAVLAIIAFVIIIVVYAAPHNNYTDYGKPHGISEPEEKRFGRQGERIATDIILSVLREDDYIFTNVPVSYGRQRTELDNVIVNKYGVFIIEVKNYKGRLFGREDDYEWKKYKDDGYGNTFEKDVKNPIKQVKRQTHILAKYLELYEVRLWVEGYAYLVNGNSPVSSIYILNSIDDIDRAIHTFGRNRPDTQTVETVIRLLS